MREFQVLLVAGTHGNEINASWLFDQWDKKPELIRTYGVKIIKEIGNPSARKKCTRYIDRDLNRSFLPDLFDSSSDDYEINRAKYLINRHGINADDPCQIAFDLHSTTAGMGCCIVIYGRRPTDLALASLIQNRLGLPIYLHESDKSQSGFLVESWPCGLVIEVGPVPQGVLNQQIIQQTKLTLEASLEEISKIKFGKSRFPRQLIVHRHIGSIDYPRDMNDQTEAVIHKERQGNDWQPIDLGSPLFINSTGDIIKFLDNTNLVPVFINEAAYSEKNIAMSFSKREVWFFLSEWKDALIDLIS